MSKIATMVSDAPYTAFTQEPYQKFQSSQVFDFVYGNRWVLDLLPDSSESSLAPPTCLPFDTTEDVEVFYQHNDHKLMYYEKQAQHILKTMVEEAPHEILLYYAFSDVFLHPVFNERLSLRLQRTTAAVDIVLHAFDATITQLWDYSDEVAIWTTLLLWNHVMSYWTSSYGAFAEALARLDRLGTYAARVAALRDLLDWTDIYSADLENMLEIFLTYNFKAYEEFTKKKIPMYKILKNALEFLEEQQAKPYTSLPIFDSLEKNGIIFKPCKIDRNPSSVIVQMPNKLEIQLVVERSGAYLAHCVTRSESYAFQFPFSPELFDAAIYPSKVKKISNDYLQMYYVGTKNKGYYLYRFKPFKKRYDVAYVTVGTNIAIVQPVSKHRFWFSSEIQEIVGLWTKLADLAAENLEKSEDSASDEELLSDGVELMLSDLYIPNFAQLFLRPAFNFLFDSKIPSLPARIAPSAPNEPYMTVRKGLYPPMIFLSKDSYQLHASWTVYSYTRLPNESLPSEKISRKVAAHVFKHPAPFISVGVLPGNPEHTVIFPSYTPTIMYEEWEGDQFSYEGSVLDTTTFLQYKETLQNDVVKAYPELERLSKERWKIAPIIVYMYKVLSYAVGHLDIPMPETTVELTSSPYIISAIETLVSEETGYFARAINHKPWYAILPHRGSQPTYESMYTGWNWTPEPFYYSAVFKKVLAELSRCPSCRTPKIWVELAGSRLFIKTSYRDSKLEVSFLLKNPMSLEMYLLWLAVHLISAADDHVLVRPSFSIHLRGNIYLSSDDYEFILADFNSRYPAVVHKEHGSDPIVFWYLYRQEDLPFMSYDSLSEHLQHELPELYTYYAELIRGLPDTPN